MLTFLLLQGTKISQKIDLTFVTKELDMLQPQMTKSFCILASSKKPMSNTNKETPIANLLHSGTCSVTSMHFLEIVHRNR